MAVKCFKWRVRGDYSGIATCVFIFCCWSFAFYCSVFTIIRKFFAIYPDAQQALYTGQVFVSFLTLLTMVLCIISDPGKLLEVKGPELLGWQFCEKCQKHRPPRSHHCSRCARCIRKMDHHCPWINNCVGEDNNMRFTQFLLFTALMSWSCLILSISYFFDWLPACNICQKDNGELDITIEITCLAFISAAFACFTTFMFVDRMIMITADVTGLELMKDRSLLKKSLMNPRKPSWFKLFSRTFGTSNIACWFVPCRAMQIRPSYEYDSFSWQDCV